MEPTAKIIADSIDSKTETRLVTMQLEYHRFIHSEFMTHRVFSRNASSSRAIPVSKTLDQVIDNPAVPLHWGLNEPGMQANKEWNFASVSPNDHDWDPISEWKRAAATAREHAQKMHDEGLHKQVVNRLLEPWQIIKVVVTATEWDNFYFLRISEYAQPEIKALAVAMKTAMDNSKPTVKGQGQWHLPYILPEEVSEYSAEVLLMVSAARCARVSYLNHDNSKPDLQKDIELAKRLSSALHMSPFEHVATPVGPLGFHEEGVTHVDKAQNLWSGNLRNWVQFRQLM